MTCRAARGRTCVGVKPWNIYKLPSKDNRQAPWPSPEPGAAYQRRILSVQGNSKQLSQIGEAACSTSSVHGVCLMKWPRGVSPFGWQTTITAVAWTSLSGAQLGLFMPRPLSGQQREWGVWVAAAVHGSVFCGAPTLTHGWPNYNDKLGIP